MLEEWVDIRGFKGHYQVSNLFNIKSLARKSGTRKTCKERLLKPIHTSGGGVIIRLLKNKVAKVFILRTLVGTHFPSIMKSLPGEEWLPIKGSKRKYEVSNLGRVRNNSAFNGNSERGRLLNPIFIGTGLVVRVRINNNVKQFILTRLMLETFTNTTGDIAEFIDGDPTNIRLSNLKWISRSDFNIGDQNPMTKIPDNSISKIRSSSLSIKALAKKYGVTTSNIGYIKNNKSRISC